MSAPILDEVRQHVEEVIRRMAGETGVQLHRATIAYVEAHGIDSFRAFVAGFERGHEAAQAYLHGKGKA